MNHMGDDFRDLAPLDPSLDAERWERMVGRITMAAAPELARRAKAPDPGLLMLLSDWVRPAVSAAAALAAVAGAALVLEREPATAESTSIAATLGYSDDVAAWVVTGSAPSADDLVVALEEE